MVCRICGCQNPKCRCKLCKSKSANMRLMALSSVYKNFHLTQVTTASYGSTVASEEDKKGLKISANTLAEIEKAELLNITDASAKFQRKNYSAKSILDTSWLMKSHKQMFGIVWDWAGKFRKGETNKQNYVNALSEADNKKFKPIVSLISNLVKDMKQGE